MLILYLALALAETSEVGYLYSVGEERFLRYSGTKITLAERIGDQGSKFSIVPIEGDDDSMLVRPSPEKDNYVADMRNGDVKELYFHPLHKKWNQRLRFVMRPNKAVRIMVGDLCLGVREDRRMIEGDKCKKDGEDKSQQFKWVPEYDYHADDHHEEMIHPLEDGVVISGGHSMHHRHSHQPRVVIIRSDDEASHHEEPERPNRIYSYSINRTRRHKGHQHSRHR